MTPGYSLESYCLIVRQALSSGYVFVPFSLEQPPSGNRIYLRHDVDYSLEMALLLAETNAELGVQGTFCILLRSEIYNFLSPRSLDIVARIHDSGQQVGLHVRILLDLLRDDSLLDARLRADFEFVRSNLPFVSPVFSWHNPTHEVLERYIQCRTKAGLLNTYSAEFFRDIAYYSDSNMRHSVDEIMQLVGGSQTRAMQLVLHPLNWVAGGNDMLDVFSKTWKYIIREREYDVRTNLRYAGVMPDGIPESVLQEFAEQWRRASEKKTN